MSATLTCLSFGCSVEADTGIEGEAMTSTDDRTTVAHDVADEPLDLATLLAAPFLMGFDVSPDGRSIVYSSSEGGTPQYYGRSIEGDEALQLTNGAESAYGPKWSPRGDLILYRSDIGGDEN